MNALNIGDSGFRLIRKSRIVQKSEATMAGSSPKQLYVSDSSSYSGISFVNEQLVNQINVIYYVIKNLSNSKNREIADDSDIREFHVYKGDLIILASDGMFDVVQDNVIEKVVNNRNENVI